MANQAPGRPWFRLASLRSVVPPPPPAPAQDPRPSLVQPTNRTNSSPPPSAAPAERGSVPSSPAQKLPVQSSSSLPNSPLQNGSVSTVSSVSSPSPAQKTSPPLSASSPAKGGTIPSTKQVVQNVMQSPKAKPTTPPPSASPNQKATTPHSASSPAKSETTARGSSPSTKQVVQTLMQSPKAKPTAPRPSPLTLPPAQLKANSEVKPKIPEEAESKNVILQNSIEKPKQWGNGNSAETRKNHNEKQNGNHRKSWGSEDSPMKVITIAGENRGAYMELIQSKKKHEFGDTPNYLYKNGVSKSKSESGESASSSSDEGNGKRKENRNSRRTKSSHPTSAFMNSNVQCVNNSLLYNASCSHHDAGVRLSLTRKPFESGGFHLNENVNGRHD
ncbi:serine/arginine repetitive matrix protein 1 [Neltuma alba]|uniref:serine/arginine repetitive matrix protein 1 n=1 Tax=Neltuma alba TaxID=207710 RepID=UPI0010A3662C|nr:serine/arginine repetitive matrix protein 1-like [Prosopis alba]